MMYEICEHCSYFVAVLRRCLNPKCLSRKNEYSNL